MSKLLFWLLSGLLLANCASQVIVKDCRELDKGYYVCYKVR